MKLLYIGLLFVALPALAGKYPGFSESESAEIDALMKTALQNMNDREEYYQDAYEILNDHRLLPVDALFWSSDKVPAGPVYEKNIFHFFWSRPLIEAELLEEGLYMMAVHPFTCCSTYSHGVQIRINNPLGQHFRSHLTHLKNVLGTSNEIFFKPLPSDRENKIPSYAEVFFLDYVAGRKKGIQQKAHSTPKTSKSFSEVLDWSVSEPVVFDTIGKSIAYKLSTSTTFTKFALSPFIKHVFEVVNGVTSKEKKAAKEALLSEIILGFLITHVEGNMDELEVADDLTALIAEYDFFGVIDEMKANDLLEKSFDRFLFYITSNTSWYSSVSGDLTQLRSNLNVGF